VSDSGDESKEEESGALRNIHMSHKEIKQAMQVHDNEVLIPHEEGLRSL
jgi:hypothetical protein